jgi:serine/threonine protein phosphatase PrpC
LNQDVHLVLNLHHPKRPAVVLGVFDGHGPLGECFADEAMQVVSNFLSKTWETKEAIEEEDLKKAFTEAHRHLVELSRTPPPSVEYVFDGESAQYELTDSDYSTNGYKYEDEWIPVESGTTATLVVYHQYGDKVLVANVGDSDARILIMDGESDQCELKQISLSHNPCNSSERRRIDELEHCEVDVSEDKGFLQLRDSPFNDGKYFYIYQLSLTRALGHELLGPAGVIWDPTITSFSTDDTEVLIVASDGLWDNVSSDEVSSILRDYEEPQSAADALIEHVNGLCTFDPDIDNTTVMVVHFKDE